MDRAFERYEQVAAFLLNEFAAHFGLERVEGKQIVQGSRSGTNWEIDGKGIRSPDDAIIIVECRRYQASRPSQEQLAAIAYRIEDIGAVGGIIVTPIGIQKGAKKVALAEKIISVHLDSESTTSDYVLQFLKKVMIGSSLPLSGKLDMKVSASLARQCEICGQQFPAIAMESHCPRCISERQLGK